MYKALLSSLLVLVVTPLIVVGQPSPNRSIINGANITNLVNASSVSAGANVTVTPTTNATTGKINYSVASSGGGGTGNTTNVVLYASDTNNSALFITGNTNDANDSVALVKIWNENVSNNTSRKLISFGNANAGGEIGYIDSYGNINFGSGLVTVDGITANNVSASELDLGGGATLVANGDKSVSNLAGGFMSNAGTNDFTSSVTKVGSPTNSSDAVPLSYFNSNIGNFYRAGSVAVTFVAGGSTNVTFSSAFPNGSVPYIVGLTPQSAISAAFIGYPSSVTTNGFTINVVGALTATIGWSVLLTK